MYGNEPTFSDWSCFWDASVTPESINDDLLLGGLNKTGSFNIDINSVTIKHEGETYTEQEGLENFLLEVAGYKDKSFFDKCSDY